MRHKHRKGKINVEEQKKLFKGTDSKNSYTISEAYCCTQLLLLDYLMAWDFYPTARAYLLSLPSQAASDATSSQSPLPQNQLLSFPLSLLVEDFIWKMEKEKRIHLHLLLNIWLCIHIKVQQGRATCNNRFTKTSM